MLYQLSKYKVNKKCKLGSNLKSIWLQGRHPTSISGQSYNIKNRTCQGWAFGSVKMLPWGWPSRQYIQLRFMMLTSCKECYSSNPGYSTSNSAPVIMCLGSQRNIWPNTWAPTALTIDSDGVSGSWLQLSPPLALVAIWGNKPANRRSSLLSTHTSHHDSAFQINTWTIFLRSCLRHPYPISECLVWVPALLLILVLLLYTLGNDRWWLKYLSPSHSL